MAIPPPPKRLTEPPKPNHIPDNLSRATSDIQDLNFKVPTDFHREFKLTATNMGMSMKELLVASYNAWREKHQGR